MKTQWLIVFEYIPSGGTTKMEAEVIFGTDKAARNYFNSFKNDPRFRRVSLVREVTDKQIMAEHCSPVLTPDPEY